MASNEFRARIEHKRDTSTAWEANNPILLNGEIIIVDTESGEVKKKIGDGVSTYSELPFEIAIADWAMAAEKPSYTANEVGADEAGSADQALADAKGYADGLIGGVETLVDTINGVVI